MKGLLKFNIRYFVKPKLDNEMRKIEFLDKIETSTGCVYRYKHYFSGKVEIIETKTPIMGVKIIPENPTGYIDGKDYSNLKPNISNKKAHGHNVSECVACSEKENVTITDEADICHECGYIYT